jgi:hypothetical protein
MAIEQPYQAFLTTDMIENIRSIQEITKKKEIELLIMSDAISRDITIKNIMLNKAKKSKDKPNLDLIKEEIEALETKKIQIDKQYKQAAEDVMMVQKLKKLDAKELNEEVKSWNEILKINPSQPKADKGPILLPEVVAVSQNTPVKNTNKVIGSCKILKDEKIGKIRVTETAPSFIYSFTPSPLKRYFKEKNLLTAKVSILQEGKFTRLKLNQVFISKDAANNYGIIDKDALLRITLISGKVLDLSSRFMVKSEVELYTGNIIYNAEFELNDQFIDALSDVPLDSFGLLWSSGFETYPIYDVEVIMNQFKCLKDHLK